MKKFVRSCLSLAWGILVSCPRVALQPSAHPNLSRKNFWNRWLDLLYLRLRDGWLCIHYNGLRCDLKGHSVKNVVTEAMVYQKIKPTALLRGKEYVGVLDDKYLFSKYFIGGAVSVIAHMHYDCCYVGGKLVSYKEMETFLSSRKSFFVKAPLLSCGRDVFKIRVKNGDFYLKEESFSLKEFLARNDYVIFQDVIENHDDIRKLNPTTLNTLRVVTCWHRGRVELFDDAVLRMGRAGKDVDNFFQGGLGVGVDRNGRCYPVGVNHDARMIYSSYKEHPDSRIAFEGYQIPLYKEAIELVVKAQEALPSIPSVGWDVAITPEGPLLLEDNCDWDICLLQSVLQHDLMWRYREVYEGLA